MITAYQHIELDAQGVPWIAGRNIKVVEIVAEHLAYRWDAAQIRSQHPHLTLGEIHSALAYYFDHEQAIKDDLDRRLKRADQIIASMGESSVQHKLQARPRP